MSNGSQRRNRRRQSAKRYRIRFDRIAAAALVFVVLIVILTSCVKSCSKDDKKSDSSDTASATATGTTAAQSSIVDNLDTSKQTDSLVITSIDDMKPTASEFVVESHSRDDVYMGNLVLVNADNEYKFKEGDTDALTLYNNRSNEYYNVCDYVVKLDKETLASLDNWMKGFYEAKKNTDLTVIGGYRTLEEQNDKYNGGYSGFRGGCSDYHTARTFDLGIFPKDGSSSGYYSPRGDYAWLDENAAEYGFIVRFPEGKEELTGEHPRTQTYRYVGKPHSVYIKQNGLCLEEYIEKIKSYTNTEPLEITVGQSFYQVYYVSASAEGNTDVPVPQNKTYTVSGNNKDGFIVTVSLN
ncbi:D-alanyl-D-alanine carboxypeptidase family protein [uncultured Ruminococcus sp.]|uniref:M15 family metallopeptidase n=1 Tax=uncultured Ruminococcus sp. TaxID=165186 RepID=UPI002639651C|nr:D-alanyl-D-alanine carboxypeptidase family protein [uncultured Ruminococcus sp.]